MRTFGPASLLSLVLLASGCGNVFVRANWNGGNQTVSGIVSIVLVTVVIDSNNVATQVTIVTLLENPGASNFTFCGDQSTRFPPNQFAQATFAPGQPCSTLLTVVITT